MDTKSKRGRPPNQRKTTLEDQVRAGMQQPLVAATRTNPPVASPAAASPRIASAQTASAPAIRATDTPAPVAASPSVTHNSTYRPISQVGAGARSISQASLLSITGPSTALSQESTSFNSFANVFKEPLLGPIFIGLESLKRELLNADSSLSRVSRENQALKISHERLEAVHSLFEKKSVIQTSMCESYQRIITQLLSMIDPSTQQLVLSDLDAISSMANGINMEIEVMQMPIFVSNGMYHTDSNTQEQRPKFPPSTLQQQQPQLADAPTVPESPTASSKPIPKSQSGRGAPSPAISAVVPAKRASARKEPTSNKRTATAKTVPPTAKAALPVKPVPPLIKPAAQVNLASALKLSPKGASRFRGPALPVAIPSGAGSGTADLRTAGAYGESPSTVAPRHAGPSNTFLSISSISGPSNAGLSTAPILPAAAIASALTIPSNLLADISSTIADGSTSRRTWSRIAIDTPVHSAAPSPVATALHPSVHGGDCEAAGHEGEEGCDEGAVAVAAGEEDDVRLDSSETRAGEEDLGSALAQLADAAATKKVASKGGLVHALFLNQMMGVASGTEELSPTEEKTSKYVDNVMEIGPVEHVDAIMEKEGSGENAGPDNVLEVIPPGSDEREHTEDAGEKQDDEVDDEYCDVDKRRQSLEDDDADVPAPRSGRQIMRFEVGDAVSSVSFADTFGLAFSGSSRPELQIWDVRQSIQSKKPRALASLTWTPHPRNAKLDGYIRVTKLAPNNDTIVIGGEFSELLLTDISASQRKIHTRISLDDARTTYSAAILPDNRAMVTTHNDGGVVLWDLRSHTQTTALGAHDKDASCCGVLVGGAGEYVVSGGGDATVRVWDVRGGTTAKRLKGKRGGFEVERVETESPVMSLACDSARDGVASIGLMNGVMSVYDFSKLEVPERVGQWTTANDKGITCVRYSPDSSWILTAGINGQCAGWHTDSFEKVMEVLEEETIMSGDISPCGTYALFGVDNCVIVTEFDTYA